MKKKFLLCFSHFITCLYIALKELNLLSSFIKAFMENLFDLVSGKPGWGDDGVPPQPPTSNVQGIHIF